MAGEVEKKKKDKSADKADKSERKEKKDKSERSDAEKKERKERKDKEDGSERKEKKEKKEKKEEASSRPSTAARQPPAPAPRKPPPKMPQASSSSYLDGMDLPSSESEDDFERRGRDSEDDEKPLKVVITGRETKKLADKERKAMEKAYRAKEDALRDDDNVFDVSYEGMGDGVAATATDVKVRRDSTLHTGGIADTSAHRLLHNCGHARPCCM